MKKIWVIVISVVATAIVVGGGVYFFEKNRTDKDKDKLNAQINSLTNQVAALETQLATETAAKVTPSTTTTSSTASAPTNDPAAWKAYTNADYGFHLTFADGWTGYRVKKVSLDGLVAAYYINIPTTDPLYKSATDHTYAGYAAPICIGVMNKSEWTGDEIQVRDFGDKAAENANYVFTVSRWQATPTDVTAAITSTLTSVMNSFTL